MAATTRLELDAVTVKAFARLQDRLCDSFCEPSADTGDKTETIHHVARLVRIQTTLRGMLPDTMAGQGEA